MTKNRKMRTLLLTLFLVLCQRSNGSVQGSPCQDNNTDACLLLMKSQPGICSSNPLLAKTTCIRSCGNCPIQCYNCRRPVYDPQNCTTTTFCRTDQKCSTKHLHAIDGHDEYLFQCEEKEICRGYDETLGKRSLQTVDRFGRSLRVECCGTDFCNAPRNFATGCTKDIVFLLDESGSQGMFKFQEVLNFVKSLVIDMQISSTNSRVSMVTFSTTPSVQWYLDTYNNQPAIINAINQMGFSGGSTHTELALQSVGSEVLVSVHGDRPSVRNVVVVITDGQSTDEVETVRAATALKMNGTEIISIGIGSSLGNIELQLMATDSKHVFEVADFHNLPAIENNILDILCNRV